MADETNAVESAAERGGLSRRAALKAGVATGVGIAAWSGVTITSLGGTPAYAAACTNASVFPLANCRNTDQGKCAGSSHIDLLAYHPLDTPFPPGSGFSLTGNVTDSSGVCCTAFPLTEANPVFHFDNTKYKCLVRFKIYSSNSNCTANGTAGLDYNFVYPTNAVPSTTGSIEINLACPPQGGTGGKNMANDFWSIIVICNSLSAPDECYQ